MFNAPPQLTREETKPNNCEVQSYERFNGVGLMTLSSFPLLISGEETIKLDILRMRKNEQYLEMVPEHG